MSDKVVHIKDYRIEKELRKELSQLDEQYLESQRSVKKWIAGQLAGDEVCIVRATVKEGSIHIEYTRNETE